MSDKWLNDVAEIKKSKAGKLYIEVKEDFTVTKGQILSMKSKAAEIDKGIASGRLSEEYGQELKEKLHFIKYSIDIPPKGE